METWLNWRANNKEKVRAYRLAYKKRYPERVRESNRKYKEKKRKKALEMGT